MVYRRDGAYFKAQRMKQIKRELIARINANTHAGRYKHRKFVAEMAMETGLTRQTVNEYLETMFDAEDFMLTDGYLYPYFAPDEPFMADNGEDKNGTPE